MKHHSSTLYTPQIIAEETGLCVRTIRTCLTEFYPSHYEKTWWRLEEAEYEKVIREVRAALLIMPLQPRRIMHKRRESKQISIFDF